MAISFRILLTIMVICLSLSHSSGYRVQGSEVKRDSLLVGRVDELEKQLTEQLHEPITAGQSMNTTPSETSSNKPGERGETSAGETLSSSKIAGQDGVEGGVSAEKNDEAGGRPSGTSATAGELLLSATKELDSVVQEEKEVMKIASASKSKENAVVRMGELVDRLTKVESDLEGTIQGTGQGGDDVDESANEDATEQAWNLAPTRPGLGMQEWLTEMQEETRSESCPKSILWGSDPHSKAASRGIIEWSADPNRFVLMDCHRGQASNRIRCFQNHLFITGVLNRTLVVPESSTNAVVMYDNRLLFDASFINFCFGAASVLWLHEFREKFGQSLVVDQVLCWEEDCYDSNKGNPDVLPNNTGIEYSEKLEWGSMNLQKGEKARFSELAEKVKMLVGKVVVFGDLEALPSFHFDNLELYLHGSLPFKRKPSCWSSSFVYPHRRFRAVANNVVRARFGQEKFVAVHLRRGDLRSTCDNRHCNLSIPEIAMCIKKKLLVANASRVFLASDAKPSEVTQLRQLLKGSAKISRLPHRVGNMTWLQEMEGTFEQKSRVVRAIIDKLVAAHGTIFQGTRSSSFSADIERMRHSLLFSSCHDSFLCENEIKDDNIHINNIKSYNVILLPNTLTRSAMVPVLLGSSRGTSKKPIQSEDDAIFLCAGQTCPSFSGCSGDDVLGIKSDMIMSCANDLLLKQTQKIDDMYLQQGAQAKRFPVNCPPLESGQTNFSCSAESDGIFQQERAPQVFSLDRVYISPSGFPFNETFLFKPTTCPETDGQFEYKIKTTSITQFRTLISLVVPSSLQSPSANPSHSSYHLYHSLAEFLPLFLLLGPIFPTVSGNPILVSKSQMDFVKRHGKSILGMTEEQLNLAVLPDSPSSLFFAVNLIQPLHPNCNQPSTVLLRELRANYFLPPGGLPLLTPARGLRANVTQSVRADGEESPLPPDWVVVVALSGWEEEGASGSGGGGGGGEGGGKFFLAEEVLSLVRGFFPPSRVEVISEFLPIPLAKELFNRAALFVADHRAPMFANMVFMPAHSSVLELRPESSRAQAVYHHLANACELKYYLVNTPSPDTATPTNPPTPPIPLTLPAELATILAKISSRLPASSGSDGEGKNPTSKIPHQGAKAAGEASQSLGKKAWATTRIKITRLEKDLRRESLTSVFLDRYKHPYPKEVVLKCDGPACPDFGVCTSEGKWKNNVTNVHTCVNKDLGDAGAVYPDPPENCPMLRKEGKVEERMNESCIHRPDVSPHDPLTLQVFALDDVFVDSKGLVFDRSYHFDRRGCVQDRKFAFKAYETRVMKVEGLLLNMVYQHSLAFYHCIIEWIPQFFILAPFLRANPTVPIAIRTSQLEMYKSFAKLIVGVEPEDINFVTISFKDKDIFHADRVIQPLYQGCGKPSPSLWRELRRMHFLPAQGLPFFLTTSSGDNSSPKWEHRSEAAFSSESELAAIPDDWVVVVARRPSTSRRLQGFEQIVEELNREFSVERVVIFNGSLSILEAKALFNRAILYVASHGAAMSNMIFMPSNSSVLEIRPASYPNACYHHLASVCSLRYFLTFGEGTKETKLQIDVPAVLNLLHQIVSSVKSGLMRVKLSSSSSSSSLSSSSSSSSLPTLEQEAVEEVSKILSSEEADGVGKERGITKLGSDVEEKAKVEEKKAEKDKRGEGRGKSSSIPFPGLRVQHKLVDGRVPEEALLQDVEDVDDEREEEEEEEEVEELGIDERGNKLVSTWTSKGEIEDSLEMDFIRENLQTTFLDSYHHSYKEKDEVSIQCSASECPSFGKCKDFNGVSACMMKGMEDKDYAYPLAPINCPKKDSTVEGAKGMDTSCTHRQDFLWHDPMDMRVFRLRNVFISPEGLVFNRTFFFNRNGCDLDNKFLYLANSTKVKKLDTVVNLVYRQGIAFYHGLIESLPQYFLLAPILSKMPRIPILATGSQWQYYDKIGKAIVGVRANGMNRHAIKPGELFFAKTVYLPLYQMCGKPSRALWRSFRSRHLLPRNGLPIFAPKFVQREVSAMTEVAMAEVPLDWIVILARRPGTKRALDHIAEIEDLLRSLFPSNRVHLFNGSLPILKARALFRRARLLVAGHGAAMANMIFMPINSTVVEIRPNQYENPCFHHLADVCKLRYYLTFGEGTSKSPVKVDMEKVTDLLKDVAASLPRMPIDDEVEFERK